MNGSAVVRPLAPSEVTFAGAGVYMGYAVRVSGGLDTVALGVAYEAVVRAFPVLGARLEPGDDGGFDLVAAAPGCVPAISVVDGDPERLVHEQQFDQGAVLSHVSVVRAGETASVALFTHHAIADAHHSLAVLAELWSCYTDVVNGIPPERAVRPYPVPVEQLLAERGIEKSGPAVPTAGPGADGEPAVVEAPADAAAVHLPLLVTRRRLSVAETAALVALGHREGVTVNGLVSAAILLGDAEIRGLPPAEMTYVYPVDLRTRITPTVGTTDGTNLLGAAVYRPAQEPTSLVELARGICASLAQAIADGTVQQSPLHIPRGTAPRATPPPPGLLIVTNWGRVPAPRAPEGLRITDFRSAVVPASRPDAPPPPQQPGGGACILSTFAGRLSIEFHHTAADAAQQRRRADTLTAGLRDAVSAPRPSAPSRG
ncbi:phthiocerol/phthiodiolone dimycocerosyl transferase family protein [Streptomyces sp. IBSNAI002]|uniref:phthiocerol/phthiodiolone dimycocerosyl transferase family protein n=1 Tax=Streptomyces sp. IBSNAI002 TaxID=3457500 RepID=UPI003FD06353